MTQGTADRTTIRRATEAELRIRGSVFIAYAYPVADRQEAEAHLAALKLRYPDATHICSAWKIRGETAARDAGEPAHTAGTPILRQILAFGLDNVVVAVIRYFGGVKLGKPGLIQAYGESAAAALAKAEPQVIEARRAALLTFDYTHERWLAHLLAGLGAEVLDKAYAMNVTYRVSVPARHWEELAAQVVQKVTLWEE